MPADVERQGNPSNALRIVIGGQVSAQDIWNINVTLNLTTGQSVTTATTAEMNTIASDVLNLFLNQCWLQASGLKTQNRGACTLQNAKAYQYDSVGLLKSQGSATITANTGSSSTTNQPNYVALCCTLLTATAGRSGRGRTYLPMTGATLSSDGQFTAGTNVVFGYAAFLTACHKSYVVGGDSQVIWTTVWSGMQKQHHAITAVRADSIPDTQHGRLNKQLPATTWSNTVT